MNKAVPWNVNGVGFDAREAAREAARRQGKSLGEWLNGVIADHAADLGVEEHEIAGQQRIDAVTSKLERLSAGSADHARHLRAGRDTELSRRRGRDRDRDESDDYSRDELSRDGRASGKSYRETESFRDAEPPPRRRREGQPVESTELLLEEAIDAMERRANRAERQTEDALHSFAKLLERNEAHRERERDSVTALAEKLSSIESRLGEADTNPIKGALARLEARLDTIGRRGAAESAARQKAQATEKSQTTERKPAALPEPFQRLEAKLNSILDAIKPDLPRPVAEASPIAFAASRASTARSGDSSKDRRLGDAIAAISSRQQSLDVPMADSIPHPLRPRAPSPLPAAPQPIETPPFTAMQSEITALAMKIEDLRRDVVWQRQASLQPPAGLDSLRADVATMSHALRELAPRDSLSGIETSIRTLAARIDDAREATVPLDEPRKTLASSDDNRARPMTESSEIARIHDEMREIRDILANTAAKFDKADAPQKAAPPVLPAPIASAQFGNLETLVRDLGRKMEAVQAPGAGAQAFDALQEQVGVLAARFERSDEGLDKLTSLERSMRDLFAHLDETRATVEVSATRAAREALRIAMEEGRVQSDQGTAVSLATMRAMQDEAEARTSSTLSAVHGTLEKVVNRLSTMEIAIADARRQTPLRVPEMRVPEARTPEVKLSRASIPLRAPEPLLNDALGRRPTEKTEKNATPASGTRPLDLDDEGGRADFIAAARRAAKVAQTDPSVADLKRAAGRNDKSLVRAGLLEQSREYVTRHKRPVLLSIAALFVILGTMAVIQRIGFDESDSQLADTAAPAQVASTSTPAISTPAMPSRRLVRHNDDLTPSALPASAPPLADAIPGSDPIQTGSITSLPAFAAGSGPRPVARQSRGTSSNLKAMAENGDGGAEYMLAAQYADGNVVPRDFTLAAQWYQKAASQNLAPAQYRLASLYEKGLGVPQDKARARTLYLAAAEAGNPRAMHNLAVLLADGDGKPDYDGAATWFRKAAQYGIHDSQYNLAILLARGIGVQQSLVQSYQWFAVAAAQGDADAGKKRDEVGAKLNANDLAVAKALAGSFRPRVADVAATEVQPPPGGWDGASAASPLNSARPKISSL